MGESGHPARARETYAEESADDGEYYDCEDGDDDAVSGYIVSLKLVRSSYSERSSSRGGVHQLHALRAETTGFMVMAEGEARGGRW